MKRRKFNQMNIFDSSNIEKKVGKFSPLKTKIPEDEKTITTSKSAFLPYDINQNNNKVDNNNYDNIKNYSEKNNKFAKNNNNVYYANNKYNNKLRRQKFFEQLQPTTTTPNETVLTPIWRNVGSQKNVLSKKQKFLYRHNQDPI